MDVDVIGVFDGIPDTPGGSLAVHVFHGVLGVLLEILVNGSAETALREKVVRSE